MTHVRDWRTNALAFKILVYRACGRGTGLWSRVSALERLFVDYGEKSTVCVRPQIVTAVVAYAPCLCTRISPILHLQS